MSTTHWRVSMYNPEGNHAAVEQFDNEAAAQAFAVGVRNRHPNWEVTINPWHIPGSAR